MRMAILPSHGRRRTNNLQILSTVATASIEQAIEARGRPVWFQLYPTTLKKSSQQSNGIWTFWMDDHTCPRPNVSAPIANLGSRTWSGIGLAGASHISSAADATWVAVSENNPLLRRGAAPAVIHGMSS